MDVVDLLPFDGAHIKSGVNFSDLEESSIKLFTVTDEVSGHEANTTPIPLLLLTLPEPCNIHRDHILPHTLHKDSFQLQMD